MEQMDYIEMYWSEIPVGEENAVSYADLCESWQMNERSVRHILHVLSEHDNGDNYVLIRSASKKGFYKTDDPETIKAYRREVISKGKSNFAPLKKIGRVLQNQDDVQYSLVNNLRVVRESKGMKQKDVCNIMKEFVPTFDVSILSRIENSVCLPTPYVLMHLARIYGVRPGELLETDFLAEII